MTQRDDNRDTRALFGELEEVVKIATRLKTNSGRAQRYGPCERWTF